MKTNVRVRVKGMDENNRRSEVRKHDNNQNNRSELLGHRKGRPSSVIMDGF